MATKLATLMMLPPVCSPRDSSVGFFRIARMAYLQPHQTPFTLMFMVVSLYINLNMSPGGGPVNSMALHTRFSPL